MIDFGLYFNNCGKPLKEFKHSDKTDMVKFSSKKIALVAVCQCFGGGILEVMQ